MKTHPLVDVGIITIRDDEFRAVLKVLPNGHEIYKGRHREYTLRTADAGEGTDTPLLCSDRLNKETEKHKRQHETL